MKYKPGDWLVFAEDAGWDSPQYARLVSIVEKRRMSYHCECYCDECGGKSQQFNPSDFKRRATDVEVLALKLRGTSIG